MNESACRMSIAEVEGYCLLTLDNALIRVSVNVGQGAHIYEFIDKQTDMNVLYKDPKGLLNYDIGGWYELFPNAGKACEFGGIHIPKHGDIQHQAWHYTISEQTDYRIEIRLVADSNVLPLRLEKSIVIETGNPVLFISEKITNIGMTAQPYLWGHHVTFGEPFVNSSCRIDIPECLVYKRADYDSTGSRLIAQASGKLSSMPGRDGAALDLTQYPDQPVSEMMFTERLSEHWYSVYNADSRTGFGLSWDGEAFPYLWIWQENRHTLSAPFNGDVCGLALEPQSSEVPILADAALQGKAPILQPGESRTSWLTAVVHQHEQPVQRVSRAGVVKV